MKMIFGRFVIIYRKEHQQGAFPMLLGRPCFCFGCKFTVFCWE